ncbi:MAG: hypothetical protein JWP88_1223 [Flaviaesturariibacter sp.]|nr:hypothetical protein [Flaviaesturariibacter sp.]
MCHTCRKLKNLCTTNMDSYKNSVVIVYILRMLLGKDLNRLLNFYPALHNMDGRKIITNYTTALNNQPFR